MPALGLFKPIFFSLLQEEEKMKQILNSLNISDFISKCTNYNIIDLFITELSMVVSL